MKKKLVQERQKATIKIYRAGMCMTLDHLFMVDLGVQSILLALTEKMRKHLSYTYTKWEKHRGYRRYIVDADVHSFYV